MASPDAAGNMVEWLRRYPAKRLGFARAGCNPAVVCFSVSLAQLQWLSEQLLFLAGMAQCCVGQRGISTFPAPPLYANVKLTQLASAAADIQVGSNSEVSESV